MAASNNPFFIEPANPLQALMTGVAGFDRAAKSTKEGEIMAGRQEAVSALQNGGDTRGALARLIGVGDVQGAKAIADFAESQANQAFRQSESKRAQSNADRSFGLQQQTHNLAVRQADAAARGFDYREIEGPDGNKVLVRIEKATGRIEQPQIAGQEGAQQPSNPYAPAGKQTDEQAKAALYARRMFQAERILRDPKVESAATSVTEQIGGAIGNRVPFGMGRGAMSESFQKYDQAKRDFVNAVLRRESGAVISDQEFANAEKQYFPAPGDTPKVLQQKRQNREEAIRGITGAAGRSYRPEFVFGNQGDIVPNGRSQPAAQRAAPQQPMNDRPEISQAREAIARGADPRAVMKRMQERGIQFDPRELELQ
jgi:hypothetical protein